jgi:hypothetical protein
MTRPKKVKPTKKKIKTLTPEPNWEKLRKAKTEEDRMIAWRDCDDFVHFEVTDREHLHSLKRWIETESGWGLTEETKIIPDTFLHVFAKNGWKARQLGYMPTQVYSFLENQLKPLLIKAPSLREKSVDLGHDFSDLDPEDDWHPNKVKEWLKKWQLHLRSIKSYEEHSDSKLRMEYQTTATYIYNLSLYLRSGVWCDSHWGENRENKVVPVCRVLAYDSKGVVKRTPGVYYPDISAIWSKEYE